MAGQWTRHRYYKLLRHPNPGQVPCRKDVRWSFLWNLQQSWTPSTPAKPSM